MGGSGMSDLDAMEIRDRLLHIQRLIALFSAEAEDMENAPLLEGWMCIGLPHHNTIWLAGRVSGHPKLGDDDICTSGVMQMNVDRRVARTASRWYRLGQSFDELGIPGRPAMIPFRLRHYSVLTLADGLASLADFQNLTKAFAHKLQKILEEGPEG